MRKNVMFITVCCLLLTVGFVVFFTKEESTNQPVVYSKSNIPNIWKVSESKQTVFAYKDWMEMKTFNPDMTIDEAGINPDLSSMKSDSRRHFVEEMFRDYLHNANTFIGDDEDEVLDEGELTKLNDATAKWSSGRLSKENVLKHWSDTLKKAEKEIGFEFSEPTIHHVIIPEHDNAFDQLTALEEKLVVNLPTSSPSLYSLILKMSLTDGQYELYYIEAQLQEESGDRNREQ